MSFVPYIGSLSVLVVSTCVAIAQFWPDWTSILLLLAVFFIGQSLADPGRVRALYLVARRVHLNPVWVIFALFAFGYLFGPPWALRSQCQSRPLSVSLSALHCGNIMRAHFIRRLRPRLRPKCRWTFAD